jgi:SAM-dependent methyltransferase
MAETSRTYEGSELELFAKAVHWKGYWGKVVRPYLGSRVLDVGAGIGSTARLLCGEHQSLWVALEPDAQLAAHIRQATAAGTIPKVCEVRVGTLQTIGADEGFDSIIYVDVLEHIEDDHEEVRRASQLLNPGGYLIVLAPAHQGLYTPFDKAVGHFRRYDDKGLRALTPEGVKVVRMDYLDSVGLLASLGNRLVLKSAMPTEGQILLWDRWMVPISRLLDPITGHRLGKSIVAVWQKS